MVNFVMEAKNSKNIFWTWANETKDYCKEIEFNKMTLIGLVKAAADKIVPGVVQSCPIHGHWGMVNFTLDSSIMNGMPVWAFPSRTSRLTMRAYTKNNEFIGELKCSLEVYALRV